MKFSVKKLTLALLNVMVVSTLSACGSGGGDDPKPDPHPDPVVKKDKMIFNITYILEFKDNEYLIRGG